MKSCRSSISIVALATVGLLAACAPEATSDEDVGPDMTQAAVRQERLFWELLREATGARIAGDLPRARDLYVEALELKPEHEDALYYLGNVAAILEETETARQSWEHLLEVNPLASRAHLQLGVLDLCQESPNRSDLQNALSSFEAAHNLNREESGALSYMAMTSLLLDDRDAASRHLKDLIGFDAKDAEALYLLGSLAWQAGDLSAAKEWHARLLEVLSRDSTGHAKGLMEGDTDSGSPLAQWETTCPEVDQLIPEGGLSRAGLPPTAEAAFGRP